MCKEECSTEWYEEAVKRGHYENLTLEGWANEIEWRIEFQNLIDQGNKGSMQGTWDIFLDRLKLGSKRTGEGLLIAREPYKPIDWLDDWNEFSRRRGGLGIVKNGQGTECTKEGLITDFIVNLSYDDTTLVNHFKLQLKSARKKHANFPVELSPKRALTEGDAKKWNDQKVLQYIDFKFCSDMTGCNFHRDNISTYLGLKDTTLRQSTFKRAENILNGIVLGQIKASIRTNKGIPF